jgi:hypothetical protein
MEADMFKRVKTIGLLGVALLAMLGTKTEAHYMYVGGDWVYHSVGCQVTIGSLASPPDPLAVGCLVVTAQVETLCPDQSIVSLPLQLNLSALVQILAGQTQVEVPVSDNPLLDPTVNTACGGVTPIDALIRNFASTVTISKCFGSGCLVKLVTSTAVTTCTLPALYDLLSYPAHLPPDGTAFTCASPIITHVL